MPKGTPKGEDPNQELDHLADLETRRQMMAILGRMPHAETVEAQKMQRSFIAAVGKPWDRPRTDRLRDTSTDNGNTGI